jgi:hypothetical protein
MKLLTVSDVEIPSIYGPLIKGRFGDVDLAISCGDLSYYYLEFIVSSLDIPLYYVRGNHAKYIEYGSAGPRKHPWGATDLHRRVLRDNTTGLLLAGLEGSLRYNLGKHQYAQSHMWTMAFGLAPRLLYNRIRYGRFLDILVTHAPPWRIHDQDDPAHQGFKAFNWLIKTFQPTYHLHGHIHVYYPAVTTETQVGQTLVINTYGYRKLPWAGQATLQTITEQSP